jgi:hypothetical protein
MNPKVADAIAAAVALVMLASAAAAEPMKCSTERQSCAAACRKYADQKPWRVCMTACSQQQASCMRTGCWNNGGNTYCGLLKR